MTATVQLDLTGFETVLAELLERLPADMPLAVSAQAPEGYRWLRRAPAGVQCKKRCTPKTAAKITFHVQEGREDLIGIGEALAAAAIRVTDLEREREGLFDELGVSYESLSAIYEIGSDPSLLISPIRALGKIVDHALGFEEGLKAAVWLVRNDELSPVHWRNTTTPTARDPGYGLLGKAMEERRGIILNSPDQLESDEPELRDAQRVAVAPLLCQEDAKGALVVWHDSPGEFDSRLMGLLTTLSSQAALILEQERLRKEAVEGEKLRREVEISGNIQQILLFGRTPSDVTGLEIGTVAEASRQIDGDFFGFFHHRNGIFDLVLGDVMGKGIPAALVGAAVKSQFLRFASTKRPSGKVLEPASPAEIVAAVHEQMADELVDLGRFVTAIYARFDMRNQTLTYVDCGHTDTLVYRGLQDEVELCQTDLPGIVNLPLGFMRKARYVQVSVPFEPDDTFLFYSDGITEARSEAGDFFGVESLTVALRSLKSHPAQGMADAVRRRVSEFAGQRGIDDDLTCIVVKVAGKRAEACSRLKVKNERGALARVRSFVTETCDLIPGRPFDHEQVAELHLALTEAASNVFRHAYDGKDGTLHIEVTWNETEVEFQLRDTGKPFNPIHLRAPQFDGASEGGFGVYIIRQIMDVMDYTREEEGANTLKLVRRLPVRGEEK